MSRYVLKKILMIVPTVILLAIMVFFISELAPGNRVEAYLELNGSVLNEDEQTVENDYREIAKKINLNLPIFYFSIHPISYPSDLHKAKVNSNYVLKKSMLDKYGRWNQIEDVFRKIDILKSTFNNLDDTIKNKSESKKFINSLKDLMNSSTYLGFNESFIALENNINSDLKSKNSLGAKIEELKKTYSDLINRTTSISGILPIFSWYGTNNRFHKWFGKVLHFDFGISINDGQEVFTKIVKSLKWTLLYILIAYILTFGMAIPLGIYMASKSEKRFTKFIDLKLLGLHSIPLFWLSTLAVIFLTSSEITCVFNIFPSIGIGDIDSDMSLLTQFQTALPHLILPSIVIALHSGAYLTTLIKRNMLVEMNKKYFLANLSRGISRKSVILKHIFPNSILPLITLIVVSLPASLAGSVVTEVIFNIPGMGRLIYNSILVNDWNVIFAIVLLIGIVTYISYVIGDILYVYFNPKVKLN